ncbi:MAG: EAL domain-containing protein [Xanthobacteraceae bacterium]|nr:EAL domain-containing protein [Xanthobacteraceae bacterium]
MRSYGFLFVATCMATIVVSVGAVLRFAVGMSAVEASLIALVLLFALMTLEVSVARSRDRAEVSDRLEGLARASSDIAREVGELRHRMAMQEAAPVPESKAASEPLAREIGELAELIEEIAQSVAVHDALLSAPRPEKAAASTATAGAAEKTGYAPSAPGAPLAGKSEDEIKTLVRDAIAAGRVDLYLQPVVTLPQRKVRYYEALSRMRLKDGAIVDAAQFLGPARAAGLLPRIDERLVHNCVQVVRRLAAKNRDVGLFLNIAPETLADRAVFPEILGYLDANRALAPSLMLEMSQNVYRSLGANEQESLALLAERGFRFSLDRIEDFRIDPRGLADHGVRFIKVPAELMLKRVQDGGAHIHPADLADLLGRYGIDLVADHIESETIVVDLLDFDVRYGQGFLFAPPRPVRADVLRGERVAEPGLTGAVAAGVVESSAAAPGEIAGSAAAATAAPAATAASTAGRPGDLGSVIRRA